MFISFSKMLSKVGGVRFGLRMRLTKKNSLWYFLALFCVLYFQFLWFLLLLGFWLMYAFFYGIYWCISRLYRLLSKKFGKLKAVAILTAFFAFLVLLGSFSNNNSAEVDSTTPTVAQVETVG